MHKRAEILLELLERNGPRLHALLTRLTLSEDVAEDLMQELFVKLSETKNLEQVENLPAYSRTVAMNLAFDWRRKKKPRVSMDREDFPDLADDDQKTALARLIETEQLDLVLDGIRQLKDIQRQVLVLRYLEQYSYDQIAEHVGKNAHHVRALCSRALQRLKQHCEDRLPTANRGG